MILGVVFCHSLFIRPARMVSNGEKMFVAEKQL